MSALNKQKNIKDPESLQVLLRLFCAILVRVGLLSDPNGLNNLEYRGAADDEEKESKKPWSDAELFFADLEAGKNKLVLIQPRFNENFTRSTSKCEEYHLNNQA